MLHTDEDVETLIDEYGLDAVVVTLMEMAATRPISIIREAISGWVTSYEVS